VAYMPQTGEFAVARSRYVIPPFPGKTIQELAIIDSAGSVNHTREIKDASAVAVNHKTGRIYVATSSGSVVELSSSAKILASRSYGSHDFTGIDIWDDQNVSLETTGERGALVEIELKFFESQAMPYAAALSLGERPGLAFGPGNVLNLTPDPLFFLTAAGALPFWTTGFAGTTDSTGGAEAEFYIPWGLPVGTCMYVGAAAVNAAFPDNLDVGNVECIQVR